MATVAAAVTRASGIAKRYGRFSPWVLEDVGLDLEAGSLTEVVGANGSGKSTLLRILAGVTLPTRGRVVPRPARVGYVPDRLPARIRMDGRTYLAHMAGLRGLDHESARRRAGSLTGAMGLRPGLDTPVSALSKGNRQKISLVQALLAPVGLLVLDEPWTGLDAVGAEALTVEIQRALGAGTAVIASSHRLGTVPGAHRSFVIAGGHLAPAPRSGAATKAPAISPVAAEEAHPASGHSRDRDRSRDLTVVELLAPAGHAEWPNAQWSNAQWPNAEWQTAEWADGELLEHAGRLWRLAVGPGSVDGLLAAALATGWSVHRVQPPLGTSPDEPGSQR